MFKRLMKWFKQLIDGPEMEPEPLTFDFDRNPDFEQEYISQGFTKTYRHRYFHVSESYTKDSPEIKYVEQQIQEILSPLRLEIDYRFELILTDDVPKEKLPYYFNDIEIKKGYNTGHHVYIILGFNDQRIKENYEDNDYWWTQHRIDSNLEEGFKRRYLLNTWMRQKRSLDMADAKHEFDYEIDLTQFDQDLYFNQDLQWEYTTRLKELIERDIRAIKQLENPSVIVKFKNTTTIEIEVTCDKWLIRDQLDETRKMINDNIIRNVRSLYIDKYFYRNLIDQNKE